MTEPGEIVMQKPGTDLHTCPACGYARGFHTSFLSANASRDNPVKSTRDVYRIILICPECGARFDVGWRISLAEFESRFVKVQGVVPASPAPQAPLVTAVTALPPPPDAHDEPRPE